VGRFQYSRDGFGGAVKICIPGLQQKRRSGRVRAEALISTKDCTRIMQTHSFHFNRHGSSMSYAGRGFLLIVLGLALFCGPAIPAAGELATPINPPLTDVPNSTESGTERAVFAGGCFWGVQAVGRLLQIYFTVAHDPTQLNRQGPDEGTQYRSEVFATSDAQQQIAEAYIAELERAHASRAGS